MPTSPSSATAKDDNKDAITVDFLDDFNKKKKSVEDCINFVTSSTRLIQTNCQQLTTASTDEFDRLSSSIAAEVKRAGEQASKGKALLDALKAEGEALARTNPKSERLQPYKAQYIRLCKTYVETMRAHQQAKESVKKQQEDTLLRRGKIVFQGEKSEEELRERIEKDPAGFLRDAVMETASVEAQEVYAFAQSRARDVQMLVQSINEMAAMFQDLAVLVQHQSAVLDSIERNVENAQTYVKKGNEHLRAAIKTQKRTRKCYCCMLCLAIVIVVLLIGGLGSFFGGAFNKL